MELNEIKKALYREKPNASFLHIKNSVAVYSSMIGHSTIIHFEVPVKDMGDATFTQVMPAQLLIRWISTVMIEHEEGIN